MTTPEIRDAVALLPCPCCASTDLVPPPKHWPDGVIYCKSCDLRGASPDAWNTRPPSVARYAASVMRDLDEAKAEIATLRDIVVTYGDKVRMANAARPEWQEVIDRAFEREN